MVFTKQIKSWTTKEFYSVASNYSSLCGSGRLPFLPVFVHKSQAKLFPCLPHPFSVHLCESGKCRIKSPSVCRPDIETELALDGSLATPKMPFHFSLLYEACVFNQQVNRASFIQINDRML